MSARFITVMFLAATVATACDSNPTEPPSSTLPPAIYVPVVTTLEVLPGAVTLEQGYEIQLVVLARDQKGLVMSGPGSVTFSSSDETVASVSRTGFLTAVAAGTAEISVRKTGADTPSAAMTATILKAVPSDSLVLVADLKLGWQPPVAHLKAGGTVRWSTAGPRSWSDVPHQMLYLLDNSYSIIDSLDLSSGSATLKPATPGRYRYCSAGCWDPPDFGIVYVH